MGMFFNDWNELPEGSGDDYGFKEEYECLRQECDCLRQENQKLKSVLQGIIDGCVHPDIACKAMMVDLKPIRDILKK